MASNTFPDPKALDRQDIKDFLTENSVVFYDKARTATLVKLYKDTVEELGGDIDDGRTPTKPTGRRKGTPVRTTSVKKASRRGAAKAAVADNDDDDSGVPFWITNLADKELVTKLREYGAAVTPCTPATRKVLERRLAKMVAGESPAPARKGSAGGGVSQSERKLPRTSTRSTRSAAPATSPRPRRRASRGSTSGAAGKKSPPAPVALDSEAALFSDEEDAKYSGSSLHHPDTIVEHVPGDNDGTLLCTIFLVAVIVMVGIVVLVGEDDAWWWGKSDVVAIASSST